MTCNSDNCHYCQTSSGVGPMKPYIYGLINNMDYHLEFYILSNPLKHMKSQIYSVITEYICQQMSLMHINVHADVSPRAHRSQWPMCSARLMCIIAVTLQNDIIRSDGFKYILTSHSTLPYPSPWWPQVQLRQISNTHLWLRQCVHTCVITEH